MRHRSFQMEKKSDIIFNSWMHILLEFYKIIINYKMLGDQDFLEKREKYAVEIRRANREQILMKKRNIEHMGQTPTEGDQKVDMIVDDRYKNQIQQIINSEYNDSMFQQLASFINSADVMEQHRGVIGMRKLLARNVDPPIKRFIDKGLTNKCFWYVSQKQFPQLKLEAAWILTNVASGESKFCERLVQRGGIQLFVKLLQQNQRGVIDQAIWGIGNLAADSPTYRDIILKKGGLQALIKVMENTQNKQIIKNGAWAITNLCRGTPAPDVKYAKEACPILCKVIQSGAIKDPNSKEVLADVVWAISYMTQGSKPRVQRVNKFDILGQIFKYAQDSYKNLHTPALKIIGNFSNGNQNHTDQLIKHGIFDLALQILQHPKKAMRRQMCWILSNIAAGVNTQVQIFMSRTDLLDKLAYLFHHDILDVKRQICWIYGNLGHLGDRVKLVQIILHYDVMRIYTNMLQEEDAETLDNVLETLFKVLFVGKKCQIAGQNVLLNKFLEYGGGSRLESLQLHENKSVYDRVVKILAKFFVLQDNAI